MNREILINQYSKYFLLICAFILSHLSVLHYLIAPYPEFIVCCDPARFHVVYAEKMVNGLTPYLDFESEYPPIALLLFFIPALFVKSRNDFQYLFVIEQFVFEILSLFIVIILLRKLRKQREGSLFPVFGFIVLLASVGPILYSRYDIVVSFLVLLALYFFQIGKYKTSWVILAISIMTKPYTIVIIPIILITRIYDSKLVISTILKELVVFISTLLTISLPFLILSYQGFVYSFVYHAERGVQIETIYSSIVHVLAAFKLISGVKMEFHFGAWELISPISPILSTLTFYITAALLLGIYYAIYNTKKKQHENNSLEQNAEQLHRVLVIAILTFVLFYKVFSSQFLIWVYPLVPLFCTKPDLRSKVIISLLIVIGALTQLVYPLNYVYTENGLWLNTVVVLFLRNILLLICLILMIFWLKIAGRLPKLSILFITIFGVIFIEIYPYKFLLSKFPIVISLISFLIVMAIIQLWNEVKKKSDVQIIEITTN